MTLLKSPDIMMQIRRLVDTMPIFGKQVAAGTASMLQYLSGEPDYERLREAPLYCFLHNVLSQMATHREGPNDAINQNIRASRAMLAEEGKAIVLVSHLCGKLGTAYETAVVTLVTTSATRFSSAGLLVMAGASPVR